LTCELALQVRWIFFDGAQFDILRFNINETLPDEDWQAPSYCFGKGMQPETELE
jgi:hypothetical protein